MTQNMLAILTPEIHEYILLISSRRTSDIASYAFLLTSPIEVTVVCDGLSLLMFKVTTALTLRPDSSGVICRTMPFTSRREGGSRALVLVGAASCLYITPSPPTLLPFFPISTTTTVSLPGNYVSDQRSTHTVSLRSHSSKASLLTRFIDYKFDITKNIPRCLTTLHPSTRFSTSQVAIVRLAM
jgi:hypothetical protein